MKTMTPIKVYVDGAKGFAVSVTDMNIHAYSETQNTDNPKVAESELVDSMLEFYANDQTTIVTDMQFLYVNISDERIEAIKFLFNTIGIPVKNDKETLLEFESEMYFDNFENQTVHIRKEGA